MRHQQVKDTCEALGLTVRRTPDHSPAQSWSATFTVPGVRVYWRCSGDSGYLLGLPRVAGVGGDTHARSLKEICYLVRLWK